MSYLNPLSKDTLPRLQSAEPRSHLVEPLSARRIRALEEELAVYKRLHSAPPGILRHNDYDSGNQTRRAVAELQEQMLGLREELRKKDATIQHLVSLESAPKIRHSTEGVRFEPLYQGERAALECARSDLASLQVKFDRANQQLKDTEIQLEAKEIKVKELHNLLEVSRDNESRLSDIIQTLRDRVRELEDHVGSYEAVSNRGEYTVTALQRELREASDKIMHLEGRLRKQIEERDMVETSAGQAERRLADLISQLSSLVYSEDASDFSSQSVDRVVRKITDLVQENALLKGKLVTLNETLASTQLESKASRETIMRLVSEMNRDQKVTTKYTSEVENLRMERDNALMSKRDVEREVELLKERLEANQRAMDATRAELELRDNRLSTLDREVRINSHNVHSAATAFSLFREQLANILSSAYETIEPTEEAIKQTAHRIASSYRELVLRVEDYENRVKSLTEQLDRQLELCREQSQRVKRYEAEAYDLDNKLRSAEGELAAGDVLRDGFKTDKERYLRGLQKLGEIMKMDRISLDMGLDMTMDSLTARAEQLVRLEADALADRSTHVYNLQRKVKNLKEQLESKELHIDLLRKKLTGLEEKVHGRIELEKGHNNDLQRLHKLERLVEKYKVQLTDARQEIQNLKAQLLGTTELKMRTMEQRRDVEELVKQVEELEQVRRKQAHKISSLKEEIASAGSQTQEKQVVAENAVQALSSELRTTKNALDSIKYREKQLLDFRSVVSRMLGLDINTLAVPDYEIITRLEKLIKAHHSTALTTIGLEEAFADVEDGLVSELEATDPVVRRSRERSRRKAARAHVRARSLSPTKRDTRVY
ncbi:coiled-coil domain-containing protein 170-like [Pomacea canaliculata]|uniref:coiled-coil domain-containing protein 170-like n=1 Tax=Pomacea canaliculata TaxID=400727 RepID=UPI000D72CFB8|nr:coiled-coil domain-containing protein 170-like [Pomacea canaliculata]